MKEVSAFFRIWLMNDAFVTITGRTWLVGIDSWNQDQLVFYLVIDSGKSVYIFADSILVVS